MGSAGRPGAADSVARRSRANLVQPSRQVYASRRLLPPRDTIGLFGQPRGSDAAGFSIGGRGVIARHAGRGAELRKRAGKHAVQHGSVRRLRTPDEWRALLSEAVKKGWSISELFHRTGASVVTIRRQSYAHGIALPRASSASKGIDWAAELKRAQRQGLTLAELAARLRVSPTAVLGAKQKLGVTLAVGKGGGPACSDWPAAFDRALAAGETQSAMARRLGLRPQTVGQAARRLGVVLARGRPPRHKPEN